MPENKTFTKIAMATNPVKRPCLKPATLERISNIIGDTNDGMTGSQIHYFLLQAGIDDVSDNGQILAKRKKLYNALANFQNTKHCANNILKFIQLVFDPSRFTEDKNRYQDLLLAINKILAFEGYRVNDNGKFFEIDKACTISDIDIKVDNLKQELKERNAHQQIFKYCTKELLNEDYFHAVFEASKGLFQRIRELSDIKEDGNKLIEQVFSSNPILIINGYQKQSEKDEQKGFCNLLKGLCGMFRNPSAHEAAIYWPIGEQDALEILGLISYCHRRLDKAQKIR